ncbi:single-stranded DNA-binding protein [Zhenpiania hominis]|uniref:single-stranded DNA-binding protein n=1 Tax=Zhenpiania hominis TaxID=2763644 RepID=UPI0039F5F90E
MNQVVLIGRLTKDPVVRYTTGQEPVAVARFSIVVERPIRTGSEKQTDFPNIVVFGRQAENCEQFLKKGRLVGISGRIQTGRYAKKEGDMVYITEVYANKVEFLDWENQQSEDNASSVEAVQERSF